MEQLRRASDGELCGHVARREGRWCALTVFGAVLGLHDRREDAADQVLRDGLPSLAGRWTLQAGAGGDAEVVCILEANASEVTVALGHYAMPSVPTLTISAAEIASGSWEMQPLR